MFTVVVAAVLRLFDVMPSFTTHMTVRVDCGTHDPFLHADRAFAAQLPARPAGTFTAGFHDFAYWRSIAPAQIDTITAALGARPSPTG